jgi:carbon monoxide dehydrogenase subunit G
LIEIREEVDVSASPASAWAVIADPYAVVDCVPGAAIVGRNDDGTFDVTLAVRFGPARLAFRGRASIALDETAQSGLVEARGGDHVGGTRARATVAFQVRPKAHGSPHSTVSMRGEVEVMGRLASVIEGGAGVVVRRMAGDFAGLLAARCEDR